ncbi:MAG: hypothetical protein ACOC22_03910 [bacterium]
MTYLFIKILILSQLYSINYSFHSVTDQLSEQKTGQKKVNEEYYNQSVTDTVLYIPISGSMDIDFDPSRIFELTDSGTIYKGKFRISGPWGELNLNGKIFLDKTWEYLILDKPVDYYGSIVKGKTWELNLNNNWYIDDRSEKLCLREK